MHSGSGGRDRLLAVGWLVGRLVAWLPQPEAAHNPPS